MYYYKQKYDLSKIFDLRKVTACIIIIILVLLIKKVNVPFKDFALEKIEYYLFTYHYDYDTLARSISEIHKKADGLPVFKQTNVETLVFPVEGGKITSTFGSRMHPILKVERMHNGVDIAQNEGTPIKAVMAGVVISVGRDSELGNYVKLKHANGLETVYGHMRDVYVKQNENIKQGFTIGTVGKTGLADSSHLHFELWENNTPQDPLKWLKQP